MSNFYVNGLVTNLGSRHGTSKAGKPFTIHTATVNGTAIEVGFKQPYKVGDNVTLDVEYAYKSYRATTNLPNPSNPPIPNSSGGTSFPAAISTGEGGSTFPISQKDGRSTSIIRQNALSNAVALVNAHSGVLGGIEMDAAWVRKQAELAIEIAYKFAAFSSGNADLEFLAPKDKE